MKYDDDEHTLRFASADEVEAFHTEVTELVRLAMAGAHGEVADPQQAREIAKEVMQHFHTVMRALNTMRRSLPRKPG